MSSFKFIAKLEKVSGQDATFIRIPVNVQDAFGKIRVKVKATFDGVEYRGTIAVMDKRIGPVLGVRKDIRQKINKGPGDKINVTLQEDILERKVKIPADFKDLLDIVPSAKEMFDKLSYTHQKEYINWIIDAKKEETRSLRKEKAIQMILEGKKGV